METAKLTSKGRLVIPKRIRDAVHAEPGDEFVVRLEGSRIVLDLPRKKDRQVSDWQGVNPKGMRLPGERDGNRCRPYNPFCCFHPRTSDDLLCCHQGE